MTKWRGKEKLEMDVVLAMEVTDPTGEADTTHPSVVMVVGEMTVKTRLTEEDASGARVSGTLLLIASEIPVRGLPNSTPAPAPAGVMRSLMLHHQEIEKLATRQ